LRSGPKGFVGGGGGVLFRALSGLPLAAAAAAPQMEAPSLARLPVDPANPPFDPAYPPDVLAYPEAPLSFGLQVRYGVSAIVKGPCSCSITFEVNANRWARGGGGGYLGESHNWMPTIRHILRVM